MFCIVAFQVSSNDKKGLFL